jgi:hypothetical protein
MREAQDALTSAFSVTLDVLLERDRRNREVFEPALTSA